MIFKLLNEAYVDDPHNADKKQIWDTFFKQFSNIKQQLPNWLDLAEDNLIVTDKSSEMLETADNYYRALEKALNDNNKSADDYSINKLLLEWNKFCEKVKKFANYVYNMSVKKDEQDILQSKVNSLENENKKMKSEIEQSKLMQTARKNPVNNFKDIPKSDYKEGNIKFVKIFETDKFKYDFNDYMIFKNGRWSKLTDK